MWAKAGTPAEHLPELGLGANELEEYQVHDLGNVYARVEHVDRDGDVRYLVFAREAVNQVLSVLGLEGDDARKLTFVVRVVDVEPLGDKVGMSLVLGENDRLP